MIQKAGFYAFAAFGLVFLSAKPCFSDFHLSERLPQTPVRAALQSSDLLDRIAETDNSVRDLSAQVDLQVRLFSLGLNFSLGGDLYYKQPDKVKLELHDLPDFLFRRQTEAYRTANVLAGLRRDGKDLYNTRIINQATFEGEDCYVIEFIPKKENGISRILVWVNASNYTMPRVVIHYEDGASLTQQKVYIKEENVYVVQRLDSNYTARDMKAEILATFRNYQINKGMADGIFEHQKPGNTLVSTF